jgi:hypothetical protein
MEVKESHSIHKKVDTMLHDFIYEHFSFIFEQIKDIDDDNNPQNSNPDSNHKANHDDLDSDQSHIMSR